MESNWSQAASSTQSKQMEGASSSLSPFDLPIWTLSPRQRCDLELILNGGFHPLTGFMTQQQYHSVLNTMYLPDNTVWPMPINLDVDEATADQADEVGQLALCDDQKRPLAILQVQDCWVPDKSQEAQAVYQTQDTTHPGVNYLFHHTHSIYLGGPLHMLQLPLHFDFPELRMTPQALKQRFQQLGWQRVVGFQTRNPMHRAHRELTLRAAEEKQANLLIHPVVGPTKPGDINPFTRVRCYQKMLPYYPRDQVMLSLLPLAMRMAGPREALWHAIIRKNHGCTHFIVGRDHAGPGNDQHGQPFYDEYQAQELVAQYQDEIGIEMAPFKEMVYIEQTQQYKPRNEVHPNETVLKLSGTEFRRRLRDNEAIPEWFSFPEVIQELRQTRPARFQRGFTLFFTGLSGAGKSTLANALNVKLKAMGHTSTLLDGDEVRQHLSSELGFSKEHRDLNIRRIGYVAEQITRHRGIALCAPIAPYAQTRQHVRQRIENEGGFIEIHVATPLEICEERDPKGLYKQARQGKIKQFTGIDDPYEAPENPELQIDTSRVSIMEGVETILGYLFEHGYLIKAQTEEATSQQPETETL